MRSDGDGIATHAGNHPSWRASDGIAYLLTSEDTTYQSFMVAHLKRDLGHDPAHDAEAIAFIRAGCPTIRRFLNDDKVARQFARLVAYHALGIIQALGAQAANQRAGMN